MLILRLLTIVVISLLGLSMLSCVSSKPNLLVKQDRISKEHIKSEDKMVAFRSESQLNEHLHASDRDAAQGEYFTFIWDRVQVDSVADLQLVFYYRASKTQAKILKETWAIDPSHEQHEFAYTQNWIKDKGDLLAWKVQLKDGSRILAQQRSYLWKDNY